MAETIDPVTGEVTETDDTHETPARAKAGEHRNGEPHEIATRGTQLPDVASVDDLVAQLSGPEPDPMEILRCIAGQADLPQLPPEDSVKLIMARILSSPDIESVFRQGRAVGAEEVEGVPLEIHGLRWTASSYNDGPSVFAVIDATRTDTDERVVVTCGSVNVMTQLWRAWTERAFPIRAKVVRSARPAASGNYPMWLDATQ